MAIWVTSDLHLNDHNMLQTNRTQFQNIEDHNEYIIKQYNSCVGKDDLVYILGDVGFTPRQELSKLIKRLNGRKILIVGNHDQLSDGEYLQMGFIQVLRHPFYYNDHIILSHYPVKEAYNNKWVYNIHGHLHGNDQMPFSNYINVNIDVTDFKPVDLKKLSSRLCEKYGQSTRYQSYGTEWYAHL